MRVAVPVHGERISPVLDVARRFLVVTTVAGRETHRRELTLQTLDMVARTQRIADAGAQVVICGAVSRPLESMLHAAGVRLIPNTCGLVERVLGAFIAGELTEQAFLMPGCTGNRRRRRMRRGSG